MIGILFLILLVFVFYYERYIYNYYKKIVEKNGEKFIYKFVFIFLFFLPFYDQLSAYFKTIYIASEIRQIYITEFGKEYKNSLDYFNGKNKDLNIIKSDKIFFQKKDDYLDSLFFYSIYQTKKETFVKFNCYNLDSEQIKEFYKIKNEIEHKYKNINIVYDSFIKINSNFYNQCTKELLMETKNIDVYTNLSNNNLNIKIPYFNLNIPNFYYESYFYNYGFKDFLLANEFFNIKLFFYYYYLFFLFIFMLSFIYIKNIFQNIFIFFFILFLPILLSNFICIINNKNLEFIKKDIILNSSYKNNKDLNILKSGQKKEYNEGIYIIERIPYYDLEGNLIIEKTNKIYKKIYSVENLFGFYKFKIEERF